jgi:hypothetical protein
MAKQANKRIQKNGWTNIQVVLADARDVELEGHFDALLMMGAPDVYASAAALARLVPHLRQNARVVAFGAKLCRHRHGRAFNSIFRGMFARATFASTPALDYEPWKELEHWTDRMEIEEHFLGWMFLAWGSIRPDKARHTGESRRRAADPHPR